MYQKERKKLPFYVTLFAFPKSLKIIFVINMLPWFQGNLELLPFISTPLSLLSLPHVTLFLFLTLHFPYSLLRLSIPSFIFFSSLTSPSLPFPSLPYFIFQPFFRSLPFISYLPLFYLPFPSLLCHSLPFPILPFIPTPSLTYLRFLPCHPFSILSPRYLPWAIPLPSFPSRSVLFPTLTLPFPSILYLSLPYPTFSFHTLPFPFHTLPLFCLPS